ncbi:extracellular solute-binding protein [Microbacterium sp. SYP-A9085]|uniref:polyamine ABC transporter substrate-binding protein n=1 Tax=Microbacterium sp. SYP-A9085 TaxID=2664454 RepID=UPI00129B2457|nr:spermidine/putrescine ABC transporter substrate-binding protein [Microbacterium sp. SYP-A9085]MRH30004.1 extracellular solute-binding protein [Microbacterium sp. SYP-A9085]
MTEHNPVRILADHGTANRIVSDMSRRGFFSLVGVVGGTALLAACTPGGGPGGKTTPRASGGKLEGSLSMYSWGDYDAPEVLSAFTKELGPKLTVDSFGSNEELIAKLVAAKGTGGYDIIVPTGAFIPQMVQNNLLMKLNKDLIPNLSHMDPAFLGRSWDKGNDYSICKAWGTTGFVYDTTKISRELKTWADFLDCAQKEASGKTSVLDDPAEITGMYYWSHGIDWNTTDTADIDKCEDFIVTKLAPHIAAFDSYPGSGAIPQSAHALIQVWNGDARQGILASDKPDKWQWVLGAPTTELWMDNWAISSTAPHPEAAHAFINFVLTPENQIKNVDYIGYHTGAKDIEATAKSEGLEMLDLVFFTQAQLATMKDGEVNSAQERTVDIYNKAKAAAGA